VAIATINASTYGNRSSIFIGSGAVARQFRYEARVGNVSVVAPMAFFPFSGWGDSFFGDLHARGRHDREFYAETKVMIER